MGKVRHQRRKYHSASSNKVSQENNTTAQENSNVSPLKLTLPDNLFSGLNISFNTLKKSLNDDTKSVASYKSQKSEVTSKNLSKKDKQEVRRQMLMKKIDLVNQMKKEDAVRKKRKHNVIIGDTNALYDALPSIDHLLKPKEAKDDKNVKVKGKRKKRPIEKASRRRWETVKDVTLFKTLLKHKKLQKDRVNVVKEHIAKMVQNGFL